MNSCAKLIEDIQGMLDTTASLEEEAVEALATEYIEACNTINEELKLCAKELHSGNPSEAIRLCEDLQTLDNYQLLNMENRDEWVASVEMVLDIPVPELLSRLAEELFFCREEVQSQNSLLKKHRLMAWRKDPLKDRLQILRNLYDLNPNIEGWLEDLKQWETVRCKEILDNEIDNVVSEDQFNSIMEELSPESMHIQIPSTLANKISHLQNIITEQKVNAAKERLDFDIRAILEQIRNSLENNDIKNVPALFQQYNQLKEQMIGIAGFIEDDIVGYANDLYNAYNQKREYLKRMQAYNDSLKKFNDLLSSVNPSKEQLIMAHSELRRIAQSVNQNIPTPIIGKYNNVMAKLNANEKSSKIFAILICVIIALVVIGVIIGLQCVLK
ncbi:MAG: hypothetical protein IJQ39_02220 [Thermoguttaceae bacterium]|nr:hypothetical protein [Thermoguttaceae bacterium]